MTGNVEKFAEIIPPGIMFTGYVGKHLETQVKIIPGGMSPFKIVNTRARLGEFIKYRLEEKNEAGKIFYVLTVENIRQEKGRYNDMIYLEPDNKSLPVIQVYVRGNILEKEPNTGK